MTRVGRVPLDSTSEAEGKATLTGSLVNVYPYGLWWRPEEWVGIWGIAGFGTGASDLTTVGGGIPEESLLSWLDALLSGLVELGARLDGGDAQRGLGAEAGAELRYTHTGIGLGLAGRGRMPAGARGPGSPRVGRHPHLGAPGSRPRAVGVRGAGMGPARKRHARPVAGSAGGARLPVADQPTPDQPRPETGRRGCRTPWT